MGIQTNLILAFSNLVQTAVARSSSHLDPDGSVLLAIHAHAGAPIRDIASMMQLSHSGAVRVIDRLQGSGLVERRQGADKRNVALVLTPAGRDQAEAILALQETAIATRLEMLSQQDLSHLENTLERILEGAAEDRLEAWRLCRHCNHAICENARCPVGGHIA
ncbi:MarR family winged helix-turn-helix transcriptional regulator [Rhodobium gokarnense]|uniref:DNA-binding MarR family transcriptional regulator n=1 Tax=Rhodobium gokarnense TaxID=364296 RepID=A0ABT3HCC5_9HYPH|nr:MarR family transcriptional regulator [Rhodobium gokarnense]MCW2308020.1 DNA-binding MarR family transcriptional regulator [Rhodobium gokarnense]